MVQMYAASAITTPATKIPSCFLIQEALTVSADSTSSKSCSDSMRHLPDNTGEWSAVVLAGPTADAVEDTHTSSYEKTKCLCVQSRHDMVVGFFCVS